MSDSKILSDSKTSPTSSSTMSLPATLQNSDKPGPLGYSRPSHTGPSCTGPPHTGPSSTGSSHTNPSLTSSHSHLSQATPSYTNPSQTDPFHTDPCPSAPYFSGSSHQSRAYFGPTPSAPKQPDSFQSSNPFSNSSNSGHAYVGPAHPGPVQPGSSHNNPASSSLQMIDTESGSGQRSGRPRLKLSDHNFLHLLAIFVGCMSFNMTSAFTSGALGHRLGECLYFMHIYESIFSL